MFEAAPPPLQHLVAWGYGIREKRRRYGGKYQLFVRDLRESEGWRAEELQALQDERLRTMWNFCIAEVPHYVALADELGLGRDDVASADDLKKLPVLDKETLRIAPGRFRPRRLRERAIKQTTGGTTGTPLPYFVTKSAMQYLYATFEVRHRNWAGVTFGQRTANFTGKVIAPTARSKPPFWVRNPAFNQLYFSSYHLSDGNLPHYIERLESFQVEVIVGYVSSVHAVARFILQNDVDHQIRPKAILLSSETLFDWIREDIQKAFNCRVFDGYGLAEMTAFISECPEGSMHISPEYGVVELVELGEGLELITTGLFNTAMPLIRYRTRDLAQPTPSDVCLCGRELPVVGRITGRIDDRLITPAGNIIGPAAMSLAFQDLRNVRAAQIVQHTSSSIEVMLETNPDFSESDEASALRHLQRRLGTDLSITIRPVSSLPRTAGGKQRLIISKLANQ